MKSVLAFGDSLTWGFDPATGRRHAFDDRWPNVVARALGPRATLITDGLRGRHTAYDLPTSVADCNGAKSLPTVLSTHAPLDLCVVLLGTNDVVLGRTSTQARRGLARLIEVIRHHPMRLPDPCVPDILIVAPPPPVETKTNPEVTASIALHGAALAEAFAAEAHAQGAGFFDAGAVARVSSDDGFHLDAKMTRTLGEALVDPIRTMLW
ncbi:MAG: GDSL-type esterase/lipase family protein [Rhodobacteraceae bacterium]|nr:GDSL-type esterase/lipase family protein [Paracoccaceae bacterium]